LSKGQRIGYVFLGIIIGICISAGTVLGLSNYAPEYLLSWSGMLTGTSMDPLAGKQNPLLDQTMLKGVIQDILASEQGKALVNDLIRNQAPETFRELLKEVMDSPEFRAELGKALGDFLKTPEGKDLINRIAKEVLTR
jgi:hypothetical protein